MKSKPTVTKSKMDKILNCLSRIILIGTTIFLICYWKYIPVQIPMHYDFAGNIDRWGAKGELLIIPIIAWLIYALISILEHFPGSWNTGVILNYNKQIISTNKTITNITPVNLTPNVNNVNNKQVFWNNN